MDFKTKAAIKDFELLLKKYGYVDVELFKNILLKKHSLGSVQQAFQFLLGMYI